MNLRPFHLAFPVDDLDAAREFWGGVMGCTEGRSSAQWIDFDFYGHQIVAHLVKGHAPRRNDTNPVDGHEVPIPHFGVVLDMAEWRELARSLKDGAIVFDIEPHVRFEGQAGEQATMFFHDPAGNAVEIKAFADPAQLFAK